MIRLFSRSVPLLLFLAVMACSSGPAPVADRVLERYESQPGVLAFRVPPAMVNVAVSTSADEELKTFLRGMETIKVMLMGNDGRRPRDLPALAGNISRNLDGIGFEDLITIDRPDGKVIIKVYDRDGKTTDAVIIVHGDDGLVTLSLTGDIDLKELARIAYKVHSEDFGKKSEHP